MKGTIKVVFAASLDEVLKSRWGCPLTSGRAPHRQGLWRTVSLGDDSCSGSAVWRLTAGSENFCPGRDGVHLENVVPGLAIHPALWYLDATVCSEKHRRKEAVLVDDSASRILLVLTLLGFSRASSNGGDEALDLTQRHCYANLASEPVTVESSSIPRAGKHTLGIVKNLAKMFAPVPKGWGYVHVLACDHPGMHLFNSDCTRDKLMS